MINNAYDRAKLLKKMGDYGFSLDNYDFCVDLIEKAFNQGWVACIDAHENPSEYES